VRALLPGFPDVSPVRLATGSDAIGRTLAQIDQRARTRATVLAITRGEQGTVLPSAGEVLREGDILALAGPDDAVDAARKLLGGAVGKEAAG
jgi:CPA2 family monovalent cation:H+ antiporter-2